MQGNFVPRFLSYAYLRGNEAVCNEDNRSNNMLRTYSFS